MATLTKSESSAELNLIAAGTVFEGKLKTPGSIRIDGKVVGEISATQNIAVGPTGDIDGNISARNITIGGKIVGMVVVQDKLVFEAKAVVKGDIRAAKLVIDEGAMFDGKCLMSDKSPAPPAADQKNEPRKPEDRP
jgi:cytoskeletal protein CcmA (bactofilin family)